MVTDEDADAWYIRKMTARVTHAAVLAIWPKRPGPWEVGATGPAAAEGGAPCEGAYVVAGRDCWGAGAFAGTLGREGAAAGRPADLCRGMLNVVVGFLMNGTEEVLIVAAVLRTRQDVV